MSLGRLLKSGKSLVGCKESESHYRMRRKNLLPKFGSQKNPFATRTGSPSDNPENPAVEQMEPAAHEMSAEEIVAANMKETRRLPFVDSTAKEARQPQAPAKQAPRRRRAWARRLNPFAWLSKRRSATRLAGSKSAHPPIQGELSLDNVKVVRNDLSDADVEIVPARNSMRPQKASGVREADTPALLEPRGG